MRIILALLLMIILLSACSKTEAIVPIQEVQIQQPTEEAELELTPFTLQELTDLVQFMVDDELIKIELTNIPILYQYLQAQANPEQAIAEMDVERLQTEHQSLLLLQFSCFNEHCSYLLLQENYKNPAVLVADLAKYEDHSISPDGTKIAIHFSRSREQTLPLGNILVFDFEQWAPVALTKDDQFTHSLDFKWPIISFEWQDNQSITVSFPDLIEPTKDSWDAWSAIEEKSKNITTYSLQQN